MRCRQEGEKRLPRGREKGKKKKERKEGLGRERRENREREEEMRDFGEILC